MKEKSTVLASFVRYARHRLVELVAVIVISCGVNILTSLVTSQVKPRALWSGGLFVAAGIILSLISLRAGFYFEQAESRYEGDRKFTVFEHLEEVLRDYGGTPKGELVGFLLGLLLLFLATLLLLIEILKKS